MSSLKMTFSLASLILIFTFAVAPVWAQDPRGTRDRICYIGKYYDDGQRVGNTARGR